MYLQVIQQFCVCDTVTSHDCLIEWLLLIVTSQKITSIFYHTFFNHCSNLHCVIELVIISEDFNLSALSHISSDDKFL